MWGRPYKLLFLLLFCMACSRPELESLDSVSLACTSDEQCPENYFCETRLDPPECRISEGRDVELPKLNEVSLTPLAARLGETVTLSFTVNKPVVGELTQVYIGSNEEGRRFIEDTDASLPEQNTYHFFHEISGEEGNGAQAIKVYLKDTNGNETTIEIGMLEIDSIVPVLLLATANLDNYVRGDTITYTARFSEPLRDVPTLEVLKNGEPEEDFLGLVDEDPTTATYVYRHNVVIRPDDGVYEVNFSDIVDVAGNPSVEAVVAGNGFMIDATDPAFEDVVLYQNTEGTLAPAADLYAPFAFKGGSHLVLCFELIEANPNSITVTLNDVALTVSESAFSECAGRYAYEYFVQSDEPPGLSYVQLEAQDTLGNRSSVDIPITLDTIKPNLVMAAFSPTEVLGGMTTTLLIAADEELGVAEPIFTWSNNLPPPNLTLNGRTPLAFEYKASIGTDAADAIHTLTHVQIEDAAGNEQTVVLAELSADTTLSPSLKVDTSKPVISDFTLNETAFSAVTGYDQLQLGFAVNEGLAPGTTNEPNPLVTVGGQPIACVSDDEVNFNCSSVVTADLQEGANLVQVQVQDLAGNYQAVSEVVFFDFTAPVLSSAQISHAMAGLGDTVVLALAFDEPLQDVPILVGDESLFSHEPGSTYSFVFTVTSDVPTGDYVFDVSFSDPLGNSNVVPVLGEGAGSNMPPSLYVDAEVPLIVSGSLVLNAQRFSLQEDHNRMALTFDTSESLTALSVTAGGLIFDCDDFENQTSILCELTLTTLHQDEGHFAADAETVKTLSVIGEDSTGNSVNTSLTLVIDTRKPSLVSYQLMPNPAKLNDEGALSLIFDEPLVQAPDLTGMIPGVPFIYSEDSAYNYTFSITLAAISGRHIFDFTVTDIVGNSQTIDLFESEDGGLPEGFQVDKDVPGILENTLTLNATRFSLEDDHKVIELSFQPSETLSALNVTAGPMMFDCGDFTNLAVVTCHYTLSNDDVEQGYFNLDEETVRTVSLLGQDGAGNEVTASLNITIDTKGPGLVSYQLTPNPAKYGDVGVFTLNFDEPLATEPFWENDIPGIPFELNEGSSYTYSFEVGDDAVPYGEGAYPIDLSVLDEVGNAVTLSIFSEDQPGFVVDGTVPAFEKFEANANRYSLNNGHNLVEVEIELSEPLLNLSVTLGELPLSCSDLEGQILVNCQYLLTPVDVAANQLSYDTEVVKTIVARGNDEAGNEVEDSLNVIIDTLKPALSSYQLTPNPAKLGDEGALNLIFDEPIAQAPDLSEVVPGMPLNRGSNEGFTYGFTVTEDAEKGHYAIVLNVADGVGNASQISVFGDLENGEPVAGFFVDAEVPQLEGDAFELNATRFSLEPGYNYLQVSFAVDDPLTELQVSMGDLPLDCGDFQGQFQVTCHHTFSLEDVDEGHVTPATETIKTVVLNGADAAGNLVTADGLITVDTLAPQLQILTSGPSQSIYKEGEGFYMALNSSEPLQMPPSFLVQRDGQAMDAFVFAPTSTDDQAFIYSGALSPEEDGTYILDNILLTDLVGNTFLADQAFSFLVDMSPSFIDAIHVNKNRFSLMTGFNKIEVTLDWQIPSPEESDESEPEGPSANEPSSGEPSSSEPSSSEPSSSEPSSSEPSSSEPSSSESSSYEIYSEPPASDEPSAHEPSSHEPTSYEPSMGDIFSEIQVRLGDTVFGEPCENAAPNCFAHTLQEDDLPLQEETTGLIVAQARDPAGNITETRTIVVLDTEPPYIENVSLSYQAADGLALGQVTSAAEGTRVSISVATHESASIQNELGEWIRFPQLGSDCLGVDPQFDPYASSAGSYVFVFWVSNQTPEGPCTFFASFMDSVANVDFIEDLGVAAIIDRTRPQIQALPNLKHLRLPWGGAQSGGEVAQYIVPIDLPASLSPEDQLVNNVWGDGSGQEIQQLNFYNAPDEGELIGQATVTHNAFESFKLESPDDPEVWASIIEGSGLESEGRVRLTVEMVFVSPAEDSAQPDVPRAGRFIPRGHAQGSRFVSTDGYEGQMALGDDEQFFTASFATNSWVKRAEPLQGRTHAVMTYDVARQVTVLYGGVSDVVGEGVYYLRDTWEHNGASWKKLSDGLQDPEGDSRPTRLENHAMGYDSRRGITVLFGGLTDDDHLSNQTWEYDGNSWLQVNVPGDKPSPRQNHAMAYDATRGVTVLFGGQNQDNDSDETWEYDGNTWTKTNLDGEKPSARHDHAMVFDAVRHRTLLFGGAVSQTNPSAEKVPNDETWEYDGTKWERVAWETSTELETDGGGEGLPTAVPSSRWGHLMVFDAQREVAVLWGGVVADENDSLASQTWEFDGTAWLPIAPDAEMPPVGDGHSMAYDAARGEVVFWGDDETWTYKDTVWQLRRQAGSAFYPAQRQGNAMAYDQKNQLTMVFGGKPEADDTWLDDTWTFDGVSWVNVSSEPSPSARSDAALAYDSSREVTVLFGGGGAGGNQGDTWEYDGVQWQQITFDDQTENASPPARQKHGMVFDEQRHVMVLFGGLKGDSDNCDGAWEISSADGRCFYRDTWEYDGAIWQQVIYEEPKPEFTHTNSPMPMAFDVSRNRTILLGYGKTWEYDGSAWEQTTNGQNTAQSHPKMGSMVFHLLQQQMTLFEMREGELTKWIYEGTGWIGANFDDPDLDGLPDGVGPLIYNSDRDALLTFGAISSPDGIRVGNQTWEQVTPEILTGFSSPAAVLWEGSSAQNVQLHGVWAKTQLNAPVEGEIYLLDGLGQRHPFVINQGFQTSFEGEISVLNFAQRATKIGHVPVLGLGFQPLQALPDDLGVGYMELRVRYTLTDDTVAFDQSCGNGLVDWIYGETCDNGGLEATDGCDHTSCLISICDQEDGNGNNGSFCQGSPVDAGYHFGNLLDAGLGSAIDAGAAGPLVTDAGIEMSLIPDAGDLMSFEPDAGSIMIDLDGSVHITRDGGE